MRLSIINVKNKHPHHSVDLRFASFSEVDDIDTIVVEVLHTTMEVFPQERAWLSRKRDASKTELCEMNEKQQRWRGFTTQREMRPIISQVIWRLRCSALNQSKLLDYGHHVTKL